MSVKSSINKVSSIRVFFFFYNYKNGVLAYFQTRPNNYKEMFPSTAQIFWKRPLLGLPWDKNVVHDLLCSYQQMPSYKTQ